MSEKQLLKVFEETKILRKPLTGFIKGHHLLRYTLIGPNLLKGTGSVCLRGIIQVGPKTLFSLNPKQQEGLSVIFEQDQVWDQDKTLVHRSFLFDIAQVRNMKIRSRSFKYDILNEDYQTALTHYSDELNQKESVNRGLVFSPNPHVYPVSVEKFIMSVLDQEFNL